MFLVLFVLQKKSVTLQEGRVKGRVLHIRDAVLLTDCSSIA
jgi:hypothetical protein